MIKVQVFDNPRYLERYTIRVVDLKNGHNSYGITIGEDPNVHMCINPIEECPPTGAEIPVENLPKLHQEIMYGQLKRDIFEKRYSQDDIPVELLQKVLDTPIQETLFGNIEP